MAEISGFTIMDEKKEGSENNPVDMLHYFRISLLFHKNEIHM